MKVSKSSENRYTKKGLEKIFIKTERDIIIAIDLESSPLDESHRGQNGAFIPITKNIVKYIAENLKEILFL